MAETMPLVEAAQSLQQSWEQTWRQVLRGTLRGEKREGRWVVERQSVERLARDRQTVQQEPQ